MTPEPAPKKKLSGFLVFALAAAGVLALLCIAGSVMLYNAARSPQGQRMLGIVGKGAALAARGMHAPGTDELRQAGCSKAFVIDLAEMLEELPELIDAGRKVESKNEGTMVVCQGDLVSTLPDCDTLAKVYAQAAHPATVFFVTAQKVGGGGPKCQRRYRSDGTGGEDLVPHRK
jgi:hypothetical protein